MVSTTIRAVEDASVNFVTTVPEGAFEARYVRRTEEYFIAYVSSQAGCDRACRFCHLTATGQTSMRQAGVAELASQVDEVLAHHVDHPVRPNRMNVNFMARGEPLLNPVLLDRTAWADFRRRVAASASAAGVDDVRYNVSTIMPTEAADAPLATVFAETDTTLYYSLYSMRPAFRRRWLPKAMDPVEALGVLTRWQEATGGDVVLHWAFIEGANDDEGTVDEIVDAVRAAGLRPRFNAVRYNPFDGRRGTETPQAVLERNFARLSEAFADPRSRIVPRVGFSAKASCGMFVEDPSARRRAVRETSA